MCKFVTDFVIRIEIRAKRILMRFELYAHKIFAEWVPIARADSIDIV